MDWRKNFAGVMIAFAFALCGSAFAQQISLIGEWRGTATVNGAPLLVDLVIGPNGNYSELLQMGSLMTQDSGTIQILPNNQVHFTVIDWEPKQQCLAPMGCRPILKPPGATHQIEFTSPTTMIFRDVNLGGVVNYERLR